MKYQQLSTVHNNLICIIVLAISLVSTDIITEHNNIGQVSFADRFKHDENSVKKYMGQLYKIKYGEYMTVEDLTKYGITPVEGEKVLKSGTVIPMAMERADNTSDAPFSFIVRVPRLHSHGALQLAHLKIFKNQKSNYHSFKNCLSFVYAVIQLKSNDNNTFMYFGVNSSSVETSFRGWLTLNLTRDLNGWIKEGNKNIHLDITVIHKCESGNILMNPNSIGIRLLEEPIEYLPFIVVFFKEKHEPVET